MDTLRLTRLTLLLGGCALLTAPAGAAATATCDRACLTGLLTQYVDAVVAHDTTKLPLAPKVKPPETLTGRAAEELRIGEDRELRRW